MTDPTDQAMTDARWPRDLDVARRQGLTSSLSLPLGIVTAQRSCTADDGPRSAREMRSDPDSARA